MNLDPSKVLDLAREAVGNPAWKPQDGKTFCNFAADFVAAGFGCADFRDEKGCVLLADEIYSKMAGSAAWRPVTIAGTWVLASKGALVFAAMTGKMLGQTHGHISTIIPGWGEYSGHWKRLAPLCANVGRENFFGKPVSFAFQEIPDFFVWIPSLPDEVTSDAA